MLIAEMNNFAYIFCQMEPVQRSGLYLLYSNECDI